MPSSSSNTLPGRAATRNRHKRVSLRECSQLAVSWCNIKNGGNDVNQVGRVENGYPSLSLFVFVSPGAEAVKVLVEKPADEPARGEVLVHQDIAPEALERLRATVLTEYATSVLVDIADDDLNAATDAATDLRLRLILREDFDRIRINGYDYPSGTSCPDMPGNFTISDYTGDVGLYLVQTIGPPTAEWSAAVAAAGEVIHFLPCNTYLIRANPARVSSLIDLPAVQHLEVYQPAFKVHPRLVTAPRAFKAIVQLDSGQDLESITAAVEAMTGSRITRSEGGPLENVLVHITPDQMRSLARRPEVLWIEPYTRPGFSDERHAMVDAAQHDHDKPDPVGTGVRYHTWLSNQNFCTNGFAPTGCISYSTKVAVFDSGLDKNSCYSIEDGYDETTGICTWSTSANPPHWDHHPDFGLREERFFCIELSDGTGGFRNGCRVPPNPPGTYEDVFLFSDIQPAHGTAVASLIAGDPFVGLAQTDSSGYYEGTGIAPTARLIAARLFDEQINRAPEFSPNDYERLMAKVYGAGARFANNSWNEYANWDDDGDMNPLWPELKHAVSYNAFSQMMDMLVRDGDGGFDEFNKPITIVFSAGNYKRKAGVTEDPNPNSLVVAPANAKNILSVGASDGWEDPSEGPRCCYQYGDEAHDCDGPAHPDDISNVLWLSMRGTGTAIDRFKPDLVAPGLRLRAALSRGAEPAVFDYTCFGGTSGAAPQVTGAAVLVDAWYEHTYGVHPSPAMVKALLTAHAADLGSNGEAGIDRLTGQPLPHSPSLAQGWGRLDLDTLLSPQVETRVYDEDHTPSGPMRFKCGPGFRSIDLQVDDLGEPMIIVLAYTDRYGAPNAQEPAVNNLDLKVIDGSGSTGSHYYGNLFAAGSALSRRYVGFHRTPATDDTNNIEMIRIDPAQIVNGDFTVLVKALPLGGKAVPGLDPSCSANQDFALYVYNAGVAE